MRLNFLLTIIVFFCAHANVSASIFDEFDDALDSRWESAMHTGRMKMVGMNQLICEYRTILNNQTFTVRIQNSWCPIMIKYNWENNKWKRDGGW
jgi:hypothetical protein